MEFTDLNISKPLYNALTDLNITEPTTIQVKSFAPIMAGQNVVGISQTGTGKTIAFLLPTLRLWKFTKSPYPQILVIVPTRELVAQVAQAAKDLTKYMNAQVVGVYGGTNIRTQKVAIEAGCDVVVGTPGRLVDLIKHGSLNTKLLRSVIIDEVDEMLNLGFRTQLRDIVDLLPQKRQNMMFSATMTNEVEQVIHRFTKHYIKIEAAPSGAPLENISQSGYELPNFNSKANFLERIFNSDKEMRKVLVFAKSKKMADVLFERLSPNFEETLDIIHSSKSQNYRFNVVNKLQDGTIHFLIATDIIARGLDIANVTHVINFDLPDTPEKYIHRIGRTGRAEEEGIAISFVSDDDKIHQQAIETLMDLQLDMRSLPEDFEVTDELIPLEIPSDYVPFDFNKEKKAEPSGPAFHEKKDKNKKVNKKIRRAEKMKLKYGKPIKRGSKQMSRKKKKKKK